MGNKDFDTKNLVFEKYIVDNEGYFSFSSELKSLIDEEYISIEDALNVIFDLMYGVINYNYTESDVDEEFESLIAKVKKYNLEMQTDIKNAVLFFKNYSYEKNLFALFSSNLKFDDDYKDEIALVINNVDSIKYSGHSKKEQDAEPIKNQYNSSHSNVNLNPISLEIRERIALDEEIRRLTKEIRKNNPHNWREILKESPVYKRRHGLEVLNDVKSDSIPGDDVDLKSNDDIKKADSPNENEISNDLENENYGNLSEKELKKLKIRSDYLSNKIKYLIEDYSNFIKEIKSELNRFNGDDKDDIQQMINQLNSIQNGLKYYQQLCDDFNVLDRISVKIKNADHDLEIIKKNFKQLFLKKIYLNLEIQEKKFEEYTHLIKNAESILDNKMVIFSNLNSRLDNLMNNSGKISTHINKKELLNNLENIRVEFKEKYDNLYVIQNKLHNKNLTSFISVQQAITEIDNLNGLIDELNQLSGEYFEKKIIEQENTYKSLISLNDEIHIGNTEKLLKECEKYFSRPMFKRQLKKYNLNDGELDIIENDIKTDIINQKFNGSDVNLKDIIKTRCAEFRKNNPEVDEEEIDDLLENITFSDVDEEIINDCKNMVKKDFMEGNITINQAELKFKNYVNKKITESNQLKELDRIKNDPNVPNIKIHLTQDENDEIYNITKTEILSVHGLSGTVENRVYYWTNQKIRDNQSIARGRLNSLKREFSNLTQLSKKQQLEFIYQIELCIYENKIKPYDITEKNIIKFSNEFKIEGKLRL